MVVLGPLGRYVQCCGPFCKEEVMIEEWKDPIAFCSYDCQEWMEFALAEPIVELQMTWTAVDKARQHLVE